MPRRSRDDGAIVESVRRSLANAIGYLDAYQNFRGATEANARTMARIAFDGVVLNLTIAILGLANTYQGKTRWTWQLPAKMREIRSGVCRYCGCTEHAACDLGCSWVDRKRTICSSCQALHERFGGATTSPGRDCHA